MRERSISEIWNILGGVESCGVFYYFDPTDQNLPKTVDIYAIYNFVNE